MCLVRHCQRFLSEDEKLSAQQFSRARSPLSAVLLLGLTIGCGYSDYMRKYQESLAKIDFAEKRDKLLGPYVGTADQGIRVRLPVQVSTEPISGREIEELPKDPAALIFPPKPGASRPIRVAIFVTRSTRESEAMSLENLAFYVFDSRQTAIWMGPGAEFGDEGLTLQQSNVPAGPSLPGRPRQTIAVKKVSIRQHAMGQGSSGGGDGASGPQEYVWLAFFLEEPNARAMIAYRVRQGDYAGEVTEAIDHSLATAQLAAGAGSRQEGQEAEERQPRRSRPAWGRLNLPHHRRRTRGRGNSPVVGGSPTRPTRSDRRSPLPGAGGRDAKCTLLSESGLAPLTGVAGPRPRCGRVSDPSHQVRPKVITTGPATEKSGVWAIS